MRRKFNPSHSRLAAAAASTIFLISPPYPATLSAPDTMHSSKNMPVCMTTSYFPILNANAQGQARPKWRMLVL